MIVFLVFVLKGFSKAMSGFVKLGLINGEPCPLLERNSSSVSWVSETALIFKAQKNPMAVVLLCLIFHSTCSSVKSGLLKSLLLSIAACQHQGCTGLRLADTDECHRASYTVFESEVSQITWHITRVYVCLLFNYLTDGNSFIINDSVFVMSKAEYDVWGKTVVSFRAHQWKSDLGLLWLLNE